jgi:hypothetical protein
MDNYKEYLEERLIGMYNSYDSTILEGFKNKRKDDYSRQFGKVFVNYLSYIYQDKDIKYEIKSAKTTKEKIAISKKYASDFEKWKKRQKHAVITSLIGIVGSILAVNNPAAWMVVFFLFYGNLIAINCKDEKIRDEKGMEKYEKNKK